VTSKPAGATTSLADTDFSGDAQANTLGGVMRAYVERIRGGDMGSLPAVLGLVVLFIVFSAVRPDTFPSTLNLANLITQAGAICVLAMGLVPVLLLGDIDLSAGVAGGACAAVMAVLMYDYGLNWALAVLAALACGAVIGLVIGLLVALLGVPSFVVTLAFFLGLQGVTLAVVGQGGSIPVREGASGPIYDIANNNMPVLAGWVLVVAILVLYAAISLAGHRKLVQADLQRPPLELVVAKIVGLSIILLGATYLLSLNRAVSRVAAVEAPANEGFPWVVPLVGVLLVGWTFVFSRTVYGRYVYAVGGNREAARRAGIDVTRIRISVFMICTMMAAVSGIIAASRQNGVDPGAGGGNVLLYAVGAAVIGGTSLFGGKGNIRDAIIGGLVIATIANGLGLLASAAYINFLVTGGVLLLAASVDAISRRRRSAAGL